MMLYFTFYLTSYIFHNIASTVQKNSEPYRYQTTRKYKPGEEIYV